MSRLRFIELINRITHAKSRTQSYEIKMNTHYTDTGLVEELIINSVRPTTVKQITFSIILYCAHFCHTLLAASANTMRYFLILF
jgi:hypothetical protein